MTTEETIQELLARKKEVLAELNDMLAVLQKSGLHSPSSIKVCERHRDTTIAWIEGLEKDLSELGQERARTREG
jgi:hypothetical protein